MNFVFLSNFFYSKKIYSNLTNYKPFSLTKRVQGFLKTKKELKILSSYFSGNYNNHSQYLADSWNLKNQVSHEHIHCLIERLKGNSNQAEIFLARYFFPCFLPKLFRIRVYIISPCEFSTKEKPITKMEIIRNPEKNMALRKKKNQPLKHGKIYNFQTGISLPHCYIFWKRKSIKKKKARLNFHGFMENQGCTIFSSSLFSFLHIKDNLILTPHSFFVNDRGFKEDGDLLYGNASGISFQMGRVQRGNLLHWTFGSAFFRKIRH
mmetsp:Transcript_3069/g.6146  ORF Transcript_3069/g.6146 Transcript_3069/m.6146 type:complete len:264 (+) Transcript_3069:86-877(+)